MKPALLAVVLVLAAAAWPAVDAASHTVTATNFQWSPTPLEVAVGDTVTFANGDGFHTWVSDSGQGSCDLPCTKSFDAPGTYAYHCGVHPGMTGTVVAGVLPEIVVLAPAPGSSANGTLASHGTASSEAGAIASVLVRVDAGAEIAAALSPAPGGGVTWAATLDVSGLANGLHTFFARATDAEGGSATAQVAFRVANPSSRDLDIVSIQSSPPSTQSPRVTLVVANTGTDATDPSVLRFEYFHDGAWHLVSDRATPVVPAKSQLTLSLPWNDGKLRVGEFDVRVLLDVHGTVAETDETNNDATTTAAWFTDLVPGVEP